MQRFHYPLIFLVALALGLAGCASDEPGEARVQVDVATTTTVVDAVEAEETEGTDGDESDHDDASTAAPADNESLHESDSEHDESAEHDEPTEAVGDADRVIDVSMTELEFSPTAFEVTAGETVQFDIVNDGKVVHEFRLSNAHRIEEHIAEGHMGHGEGEDHHSDGGDVFLELEAGESGTLTVTFPSDTSIYTEIACLIPGHYEAGMRADLAYT